MRFKEMIVLAKYMLLVLFLISKSAYGYNYSSITLP